MDPQRRSRSRLVAAGNGYCWWRPQCTKIQRIIFARWNASGFRFDLRAFHVRGRDSVFVEATISRHLKFVSSRTNKTQSRGRCSAGNTRSDAGVLTITSCDVLTRRRCLARIRTYIQSANFPRIIDAWKSSYAQVRTQGFKRSS